MLSGSLELRQILHSFHSSLAVCYCRGKQGVFADIFGHSKFLELPVNCLPETDSGLMEHIIAAADSAEASSAPPLDSCYDKAVRNVQDLDYFENKNRLRELACGQWLEMLSCSWYASGVRGAVSKGYATGFFRHSCI